MPKFCSCCRYTTPTPVIKRQLGDVEGWLYGFYSLTDVVLDPAEVNFMKLWSREFNELAVYDPITPAYARSTTLDRDIDTGAVTITNSDPPNEVGSLRFVTGLDVDTEDYAEKDSYPFPPYYSLRKTTLSLPVSFSTFLADTEADLAYSTFSTGPELLIRYRALPRTNGLGGEGYARLNLQRPRWRIDIPDDHVGSWMKIKVEVSEEVFDFSGSFTSGAWVSRGAPTVSEIEIEWTGATNYDGSQDGLRFTAWQGESETLEIGVTTDKTIKVIGWKGYHSSPWQT